MIVLPLIRPKSGGGGTIAPSLLPICTGILWNFDFHQFEISSLIFFSSLNWEKIPVSKIQNGISKWTKMEFPSFPFLWFTVVGEGNPPDQKLVMYASVNCKKRILGKWRAWQEIQNLHMRFVILKVRNPLLCTVSRGPLYVIACSSGLWDWPTWLNIPWQQLQKVMKN